MNLSLPLTNTTNQTQTVTLTLETPLKEDKLTQGGLRFQNPSFGAPHFRGTVRLRYKDDRGEQKTRYVHLWQRIGALVDPLVQIVMPPATNRLAQIDFIYPPDSTPPQVLTIKTLS